MEGRNMYDDSESSRRSSPLAFPQPETAERSQSPQRSERKQIYDLRKQLLDARQQIQTLKKRAAEQDAEMHTLVSLVKQINGARLTALQEAARANEELRLYKLRFEDAKSEIHYAQDLLRIVERQRNQAEQAALDARTEARVLNLEKRAENVFRDTRQNMEHQRRSWQATIPESESEDGYTDPNGSNPDPYEEEDGPLSAIQPEEAPPPVAIDPPTVPSSPAPLPISPRPVVASPRAESILLPPRSIHNASPAFHHDHNEIPPDGFIPSLDGDNVIRIPPPHELARPPPTPDRVLSPALSDADPLSFQKPPSPAPSQQSRRTHRQGTGSSASTTLSQFGLMQDPIGAATPLSAIPEVYSGAGTPNQYTPAPVPSEGAGGGGGLSRQPSLTHSVRSARTAGGYTASVPTGSHSRKESNGTTVLMVPPPNPHVTTSRPGSRMSAQSHHQSLSRRQSVGSVASSRRTDPPPANASYYAGVSAPAYAHSRGSRHDLLDELRSEPGSAETPPESERSDEEDPLTTPRHQRLGGSIYAGSHRG